MSGSLDIIAFMDFEFSGEDIVDNYEIDLAIAELVLQFVESINVGQEGLGIVADVLHIIW